MEKVRLSKIMARRGLCSRREADRYIEKGLVFVDGERITGLGVRSFPDQEIRLDANESTLPLNIHDHLGKAR